MMTTKRAMSTEQGVRVVCDRTALVGQTVPCFECGRRFVVPPVALMVMSGPELLGTFGNCCLHTCCRKRVAAKTRELAAVEELR